MIGEYEVNRVQLHQLPHTAVPHRQLVQQAQRLVYNPLTPSPELQIRDYLRGHHIQPHSLVLDA